MSNNGACIKIATDFIAPSQLAVNQKIVEELQREGIEDIVGLEAVLLHCWRSLQEKQAILPQDQQDIDSTRKGIPLDSNRKRVAFDVTTHRSRKRHWKRQQEENDVTQVMYHCPDPDCSIGLAHDRMFPWHGLYRHMYVLDHGS